MGKKKKSSNTAAAGESTTDAPSSASSTPTPSTTAAAIPPVTQPWTSNYEAMKLTPIVADPNLFLANDSLAKKVNQHSEAVAATSSSSNTSRRFQFGIYDSKADTVGRRAIALRAIKAGTLLLSERGQPWITHEEHVDKVCHQCAACLYDPKVIQAKLPDGSKPPSRHLHCDECDQAFYCSVACQTKHRPVHALECPALQQADEISDMAKVNVDLVRAAIKYVVSKGLEARNVAATQAAIAALSVSDDKDAAGASSSGSSSSSASTSTLNSNDVYDPYEFQSTAADCELLMDHMPANNPIDLRNMRDAGALILKSLPTEFNIETERIASFMCRLNSNCHALNLEEHATIQFGFGLYPLCAIFNHSCLPNCIFINEGSNLTFRVIRDVEANEELTVNYVSLYAPRTVRRKELWVEKKFFCQCRRCNLKPKNEEERKRFALDGQLGGVACQAHLAQTTAPSSSSSSSSSSSVKAKCLGYYRINYQMRDAKVEAEKRRQRRAEKAAKKAAQAAANNEPSSSSSSSSEIVEVDTSKPNTSVIAPANSDNTTDPLSSSDDESDTEDDYPLFLRPKVTSAKCTACGHTGKIDALTAVQQTALEKSEELLSMYSTGSKTPQQVKDEFESFMQSQLPLLHPNHAVLFNLLLPLVNVTSALHDFKKKLEYCKRVIEMAESCYPPHFLPTCNYYQALANTYNSLIQKGLKEKVPKGMLQKYKDERISVLEKLATSMAVCRGAEHILTKAAVRDVTEARKQKLTL